jgi:hypothetical protein
VDSETSRSSASDIYSCQQRKDCLGTNTSRRYNDVSVLTLQVTVCSIPSRSPNLNEASISRVFMSRSNITSEVTSSRHKNISTFYNSAMVWRYPEIFKVERARLGHHHLGVWFSQNMMRMGFRKIREQNPMI